ncbi:MAG: sulfite exporter TauE/SafE family protein [Saprospiraceae bacterium]|nr:sulfite exporter TauE/SafE family protein [Saprospiraceae bacterium]
MSIWDYIIVIVGSFLAGSINTLAGNGSTITLTILTEVLGLPGNLANGTNRVGIFTQSAASTWVFWRGGKLNWKQSWAFILFSSIGAIAGALVAVWISSDQFESIFRYLMIFMLFVLLFKPERWLRSTDTEHPLGLWAIIPLCLALGFYGGFIQMGMGIFFLAAMVLAARYSLTESNAVKAAMVGIYTFLAILIFEWQGLIDWEIGLLMAIGQTIGGYLTALYAAHSPKANVWAHRVLVAVVILSIIKMFDLI